MPYLAATDRISCWQILAIVLIRMLLWCLLYYNTNKVTQTDCWCVRHINQYLYEERHTSATSCGTKLIIGVMNFDLWHQVHEPWPRQAVYSRYSAKPQCVSHPDKASVRQLKCTAMSRLKQLTLEISTDLLQLISHPSAYTLSLFNGHFPV